MRRASCGAWPGPAGSPEAASLSAQAKPRPSPAPASSSMACSPALPLQNTFRTPVYTTSLRRNAMGVGLVFEADLFTTKHISHWVLQGVCLTLNSD